MQCMEYSKFDYLNLSFATLNLILLEVRKLSSVSCRSSIIIRLPCSQGQRKVQCDWLILSRVEQAFVGRNER